jgi:poly(ADP-ribose) glycohydrolase ARH3
MADRKQFTGCFLGQALGDAMGAPYEGGLLEKMVWRLIGRTTTGKRRYTDDTQMSLDVAESICRNKGLDQDDLARIFAASYRWSRGYGAGTAGMLKRIKKGAHWQEVNRSRHPEGSSGNGAAMRAPIAALAFYGNDDEIARAVQKISEITHTHPLAREGALLIARATSSALSRSSLKSLFETLLKTSTLQEYQLRLKTAEQWLTLQDTVSSATVVQQLGNGMAAVDSCVTALYIAARYIDLSFSRMLNFIQKCSGDTDTIGAMAGAIWGAYNGMNTLDRSDIEILESASRIEQLAEKLYHKKFHRI